MKPLPRSFYLRPTTHVARDLLGKYFVRKLKGKTLVGRVIETEAYCEGDLASHSYRGKTKRNEVMFGRSGYLYVYFTYGMHFCANVVTREEGIGEAVLIRAVEPVEGIEVMMKNRQRGTGAGEKRGSTKRIDGEATKELANLTNGPAKFCEAFGIGRKENGTDLLGDEIFIAHGEKIAASTIGRSTRIGIRNGTEKKWRFFVKGNRWVSR